MVRRRQLFRRGPADTLNMMGVEPVLGQGCDRQPERQLRKKLKLLFGRRRPGMATNCVDSLNTPTGPLLQPILNFWTNGTSDNLWSTPGNWSPSGIPTSIDSVVFNGTGNFNCVINSSPTIKAITLTAYSANLNFTTNDTMKVLNMLVFSILRSLTGTALLPSMAQQRKSSTHHTLQPQTNYLRSF